jgi:hypothetical protein
MLEIHIAAKAKKFLEQIALENIENIIPPEDDGSETSFPDDFDGKEDVKQGYKDKFDELIESFPSKRNADIMKELVEDKNNLSSDDKIEIVYYFLLNIVAKFNINGELIKKYVDTNENIVKYTYAIIELFFSDFTNNYLTVIDYIVDADPKPILDFFNKQKIDPSDVSATFITQVVNKRHNSKMKKEIAASLLIADLFNQYSGTNNRKDIEIFNEFTEILRDNIELISEENFQRLEEIFSVAGFESKEDISNIIVTLFKMGIAKEGIYDNIVTEIRRVISKVITGV